MINPFLVNKKAEIIVLMKNMKVSKILMSARCSVQLGTALTGHLM